MNIGAGAIAVTATYPLDVLRARVSALLSPNLVSIRSLLFQQHNLSKHGVINAYRGLSTTLIAMSLFIGLQQSSYDSYRSIALEYGEFKPSLSVFLTCGICSAITAQTIVYPLDVIRRRIQVDTRYMSDFTNYLISQKDNLYN